MKLYFVHGDGYTSDGHRKYLSQVYDEQETMKIINNFLEEHNFKSYYTRTWYEKEKEEVWYDVGSHSEFFMVADVEPDSCLFQATKRGK